IIKVIFVLFLFLSGLIGACFIGISITYPPCCYYINVGEGKCREGGTEGEVPCPGLYSNLRRGTMDLSPRPTKQTPAHPFYSSVQAFKLKSNALQSSHAPLQFPHPVQSNNTRHLFSCRYLLSGNL